MGRPALAALSLLAKIGTVSAGARMAHGTARAETDGAPDTERYTLRAEVGLEYDTNAHRTEIVAGGEQPAAGRLAARAAGAGGDAVRRRRRRPAPDAGRDRGRQDLRRARPPTDEDVAIAQSSLAWAKSARAAGDADALRRLLRGVPGAARRTWSTPASGATFARWRRRRSSAGSRPTRFDLSLSAGYRRFVFKPDRDDDFNAPTAAVELRWTRQTDDDADWEASTGAAFEHRAFGGPALTIDCPPRSVRPAGLRLLGPRHAPRRLPDEPPRPAARRPRAGRAPATPSTTTARTATARRSCATS